MPDSITPQQRSYNMSCIHSKDTKPEMLVRKFLWSRGYRYRLNHPRLPGKPDIVLRKYRTCIFINGCFWHGHRVELEGKELSEIENSDCCKIPKSNREFWVKKIIRNKERDYQVQQRLSGMGWHCITIWECDLKVVHTATPEGLVPVKQVPEVLTRLEYTLNNYYLRDHSTQQYTLSEEHPAMAAEDNLEYN